MKYTLDNKAPSVPLPGAKKMRDCVATLRDRVSHVSVRPVTDIAASNVVPKYK